MRLFVLLISLFLVYTVFAESGDFEFVTDDIVPAKEKMFIDEEGNVLTSVEQLPYHKECRAYKTNTCNLLINKAWKNEKCEKCTCIIGMKMCCSIVQRPIDPPSHCIPLFLKDECKIVYRKKKDYNKKCKFNRHPIKIKTRKMRLKKRHSHHKKIKMSNKN